MALIIPNESEVDVLSAFIGRPQLSTIVLRLYGNDFAPTDIDNAGSFLDVSIAGYAPIQLSEANWVITAGDPPSTLTYPQVTFNFTGGGIIYGWYMHRQQGFRMVAAERFDSAPLTIPSGGGTLKITPVITLN
jgi:hypothetical protein